MTSLRFLSLRCAISLRTWALLAQECTVLQELEVESTSDSFSTEGGTSSIISFPLLRILRLLGTNVHVPVKIMSSHLVLPSIQDLTIHLFRPFPDAAPTVLRTIVTRVPDLRRLYLYVGSKLRLREPWQTLKGLRNLRSLAVTCECFWKASSDVQGLLESLPQLQELSLSFTDYQYSGMAAESKLAFTFLWRLCPALRILRLGIDVLEIDHYSGFADGVVFDRLEELHLRLTGMAPRGTYESLITRLAGMCPHVRMVALVLISGFRPLLSSSDMETMFYACQARGRSMQTRTEATEDSSTAASQPPNVTSSQITGQ